MLAIAKSAAACALVLTLALAESRGIWAEDNFTSNQPKPYVTISGAHSKIEKPGYFLITTAKEWAELWCRHTGKEVDREYDFFYNRADVPEVNFDECMVIAIFEGNQKNIASLKAESFTESEKQITFRYEEKGYQTGGSPGSKGAKGDEVTPFGFFIVKQSRLPIALEKDMPHYKNTPPIWKEIYRFPRR